MIKSSCTGGSNDNNWLFRLLRENTCTECTANFLISNLVMHGQLMQTCHCHLININNIIHRIIIVFYLIFARLHDRVHTKRGHNKNHDAACTMEIKYDSWAILRKACRWLVCREHSGGKCRWNYYIVIIIIEKTSIMLSPNKLLFLPIIQFNHQFRVHWGTIQTSRCSCYLKNFLKVIGLCCCSLEFSTVIVQVMTMDITISLKMPTNCTVMCLCLCLQITLIWQFVTMLCCLRLYFLFTRPLYMLCQLC